MSAEPTYLSPIPEDTDLSPAHRGAEMLGLPLFPQGEQVAGVILARNELGTPLFTQVSILIPRRATKTTSIWATLLGLCDTIPGFRVVTTAQSGRMASQKMREVMGILQDNGLENEDPESGKPIRRTYWNNGLERIVFHNKSVMWVVPPKASAFRSEAADVEFFDESGELDDESSDDLQGGALPLLDTRPMGQVIVAGTPSKKRKGLLWDTLQEARGGKPDCGIVDYSVRDDEELVAIGDDGLMVVEDILRRVHPGIGTLTTFEKIAKRLEKMGQAAFEREYGCRFAFDNETSALPFETWQKLGSKSKPYPTRVALGFDVAPDSSTAALAAAWVGRDGRRHVYLLKHGTGSGWVAREAAAASAKHDRAWVGHDVIGANQATAEALARTRPGPPLKPRTMRQMMAAAQLVARGIKDGELVHYNQPELDAAVRGAAWRDVANSGRLFGRQKSSEDVTPLVAVSVALHVLDELPKAGVRGIV